MQEPEFYASILSELTDAELGIVVAREFNRRKHIGVLFFVPADDMVGRGVFMSLAPAEYTRNRNAASQLIMFATLAGACKELPISDPGDDILSDTTPWTK